MRLYSYKNYVLFGLFFGLTLHTTSYPMAALRANMARMWTAARQPLAQTATALKQSLRPSVTITEFSQKGVAQAIDMLVKDRVPVDVQLSLKNIIKGPVVDSATLKVFETNVAKETKTPANLFLRFFGDSVEKKSIALAPELEAELKGFSALPSLDQQKKAFGLVQKMIKTPEGKISLDKALNLFKQSKVGTLFWPELEESLRSSIEKALQAIEVKVVGLPAEYWMPKGGPATTSYAEQLASKLNKDLFADYQLPLNAIAESLHGTTPPSLVTTAPEAGSIYGAPEFPATRSGQLVVRSIPAGLPGKPSPALLEGTAEKMVVVDPAIAGTLVTRGSDDKKVAASQSFTAAELNFLGSALDIIGKAAASSKQVLVPFDLVDLPQVRELVKKQDLVPVWLQPTCLPENMKLEGGNASSILNEAGEAIALVGHTKVNGYLPALMYRPLAAEFVTMQKPLGYPACVQPLSMIDKKSYAITSLEGSGALGALALYIPQAAEEVQRMKATSLTLSEKKKPQSVPAPSAGKELQPFAAAQAFMEKQLKDSGIDLELFYRRIIKQLVISSIKVDEPVVKKWVDAGGPAASKLAISAAYEQSLKLFGAYNELLVLVKTDVDAKTSLDNLKATIFTVLGENNDIEGIRTRLKKVQDALS